MNKMKRFLSMVMALGLTISASSVLLAACGDKDDGGKDGPGITDPWEVPEGQAGRHTYRTYTSVSPSNWNELTYQDNNDTQIMGYLGSSFYTYDFDFGGDKFDDQGNVIADNIVESGFSVECSAATGLEDVTADYAGDENFAVPEDAESGYAYKITLRDDLKWQNGDEIHAEDFVYTMQQQLDPLFLNYRADSFYNGATVIHNAKEYLYQGQAGLFDATMKYTEYSTAIDSDLIFHLGLTSDGSMCHVTNYIYSQVGVNDAPTVALVIQLNWVPDLDLDVVATMEGKTFAQIKADPAMNAEWEKLIGFWQTEPNEELHFFVANHEWPAVDFDDVGIFVGDTEDELIVVLDKQLELLEDDGSIGYKAAYNFASLPLVHKATYEANKVEPIAGSDLWTSTYHSSVASTMSWGPYKLTEFQAGKYYKLEKNENWYGYQLPEYAGQYETDVIECETITEWQTAWMMFLQGGIDAIGIDVSVATDYKNSDQAYYTPDDYVGSLQLQSDKAALANREEKGVNKTILSYPNFRKALSLALDRADFTNKTTTASMAGYGLFGIMHYYDVESGAEGLYRNSDEAKKVLCNVYGVNVKDYENLDDAVADVTGYDPAQAKGLVTWAYYDALANGDISAKDKVVLTYGASTDNESVRRSYNYLNKAWKELMKGTPLQGRFTLEFDASFGTQWANSFRNGEYDICAGGWTGAAWDPGYMLMAYCSPDYMYSKAWDTSKHMIEISVHGVSATGTITNNPEDVYTATMPIFVDGSNDWWGLLNGPLQQGRLNDEFRVEIIAALEQEILLQYYTVPYSTYYSASLMSFKTDYITYDYNTFMGYGGIRYMSYNYDDAEWKTFVDANKVGGMLNYK